MTVLERAFTTCLRCQELGTWDGDFCPDCAEKDAQRRMLEARRANWPVSLARCHVPAEYQTVPPDLRLPRELASWRGQPWAVTLFGSTGVGKTWLAVRLLGELYCQGRSGYFADAVLATRQITNEWKTDNDGRELIRLLKAPVLVLDDWNGKERPIDREQIAFVLRSRHARRQPTILTSNLDTLDGIKAIDERLLEPIASRLSSGLVFPVKHSTDRRRRA